MARLDDRGGRDAAGKGPYHRPESELVGLRELGGWSLGDGEPDIRGWEVQTVGGRAIGNVRDLLVDRAAGEVVLLDIDLDGASGRARAPIRAVQIDRAARVVRMDSADIIAADAAAATHVEGDIPRDGAMPAAHTLAARPLGRDDMAADRDYPADDAVTRTTERLADGTIEETVVERRPVVYEEVVVRRRVVDPDAPGDASRGDTRAD